MNQLREMMAAGKLTARRLTEMYLERIKVIDSKTCAVVEINPDALAIAGQLDQERDSGRVRSPLHGIPVLIKDNIETADRMKTTAGSLALVDAPTPQNDAFVVRKLRAAGAVIIGKTNLSEWANFRSTHSISGWSARGGQTNNPYFLNQNPCGSSSGSGVAVSANLCGAAVGTETNGSILCPAVTNGVVGLKPTVGLISRSGIIPIAHSQDTAGPMTRSVADAAIMLTAMAGTDGDDPATSEVDVKRAEDYTRFLDSKGLKGIRIGVVMQFLPKKDTQKHDYYQKYIEVLERAGAIVVEVSFPPESFTRGNDRLNVLLYEFKNDLNKYLPSRGGSCQSLADLIRFNEEHKDVEMPKFGQELFIQAEAKGDLMEGEYLEALERVQRLSRKEGIDALLAKENLDVLAGPTVGSFWSIPAVAGYPSITVPLGLREKIATGFTFCGRAWSEPRLIACAYAFEQKTQGRVIPQLLPS